MAGLQDMAPMVPNWCVTRAVRAPMRAAAAAASQPAWPPPITMTSKSVVIGFEIPNSRRFTKESGWVKEPMFHVKHGGQGDCGVHQSLRPSFRKPREARLSGINKPPGQEMDSGLAD